MAISIFDHRDYRDYLEKLLEERSQGRRGLRGELAQAIGSQNAFVSQVLGKRSHFNLEHAERVNLFVQHNEEEAHFFLLMVQRTRAGTRSLQAYFDKQMEQVIQQRLILKNRFKVATELSAEDQATYYSSWLYGAARVMVSIGAFQTREALAKRLGISLATASDVLEFLLSRNLITQTGERFDTSTARMHLGADSPLVARHHTNWRMRAIQALDEKRPNNLHYSSVLTVSNDDAYKIKKLYVDFIEKVREITRESKEEDGFVFNADFFRL